MSWEQVGNSGGGTIVKLGEGEGQVREVVGVFKRVRAGQFGPLFDFEVEGGAEVTVPRSKALDELDPESNAGQLVRLEYQGMKPTKSGGTYKDVRMSIYNGPISAELAAKYPSLIETPAEGAADEALPF